MTTATSGLALDEEATLDRVFRALGDPTRRAIIGQLSHGEATMTQIADQFDMSLPGVSKHVGVLEDAGLVHRWRSGRSRRCRLEVARMQTANTWLVAQTRFLERHPCVPRRLRRDRADYPMTATHERLEVSRLIRASRERVFAAWTDPDMIVQWWGAGPVRCTAAEMDLTFGGAYRIANETPDGSTMWITGTFSRIDPPSRLAYTWAMEPIGADTEYSLVEVAFDQVDNGTLVTVQHTRIANPEARQMHLEGWIGCLDGLNALIGDRQP